MFDRLHTVVRKGPEDVMESPCHLAMRSYTSFPWSMVSPTVGLGRRRVESLGDGVDCQSRKRPFPVSSPLDTPHHKARRVS